MCRRIRWGIALLAVMLLAMCLYYGAQKDESLPAEDSCAAMGFMLLEKGKDLYVLAVTQDSAADKAGICPGDTILLEKENGKGGVSELDALFQAGEASVTLRILREGSVLHVTIPVR